MYSLIETRAEIRQAQIALEKTLKEAFPNVERKHIGYPAGRVANALVHTDTKYWFRSALLAGERPPTRRLNWFGEMRPGRGVGITVEINTPLRGRSNQLGGYFARDETSGKVYLFHSGAVGGGRKGVGQAAFLEWRRRGGGSEESVSDASGNNRSGIRVMAVDGPTAGDDVIRYIASIVRFKRKIREGTLDGARLTRRYRNRIAAGIRADRQSGASRRQEGPDGRQIQRFEAALHAIEPRVAPAARRMLAAHYSFPDRTGSMKQIARAAAYGSYLSGNSIYGRLARQITLQLGRKKDV